MTDVLAPVATDLREQLHPAYQAINWNQVSDFDKQIWEKLTSQFWLDTRIPLSNDIASWATLTDSERELVLRVFTGLTQLDTVQNRFAAPALMVDARNQFEEAIYSNIGFMEAVHAKSYSSIFSTLSNTKDINEAFRWSAENVQLRRKVDAVMKYYRHEGENTDFTRAQRKVASVFLESFLFYSGFYLPLYLSSKAKLTNTSDLIRLILRDEAVHGYYIGAKFQDDYALLSDEDKGLLRDWVYDFLEEIYDNEVLYTQSLYDFAGLTEEVKTFMRYNANRALMNLGLDPLFASETTQVNPAILSQLSLGGETHDFFSQAGNSYKISKTEVMEDADWEF